MKKFFSLILVLAMTASLLCSPVLAADRVGKDSPNQSTTANVNIKLDPDGLIHKYCIDIEFANPMLFSYDEGIGTWDPEKYAYTGGGTAGWTAETSNTIKIVNHSDMPVKYDVTPENVVETYGDLDITIEGSTGTIDGCNPNTPVGSKNASAEVGIDGEPDNDLTETSVKLGEVLIVISKP